MSKKRRHHFVWKYYLKAWMTPNGVVPCFQNGRIFSTSPDNLAVRKDFYRLRELSQGDLWLIKKVLNEAASPALKEMNRRWLPMFAVVFELKKVLRRGLPQEPDLRKALDEVIQNAEENLHSGIEGESVRQLDALREGDAAFLESFSERAGFLHFLALQYMRTEKMEREVVDRLGVFCDHRAAPIEINPEALWPVLRHIFATNISYSLHMEWRSLRRTVLRAGSADGFITTDQPSINLAASNEKTATTPDSLDLFFPVSPEYALLLEFDHPQPGQAQERLSKVETEDYNLRMWTRRGRQAYATSEDILEVLSS